MKEPKVIEMFADNGEHSHWQLIDEHGEVLWSEEPTEVKNNAVLPRVSKSLKCDCKHSGSCRYETVIVETKELCRHKE